MKFHAQSCATADLPEETAEGGETQQGDLREFAGESVQQLGEQTDLQACEDALLGPRQGYHRLPEPGG